MAWGKSLETIEAKKKKLKIRRSKNKKIEYC